MAKINVMPEVVIRELRRVYNDYKYMLDFDFDDYEYQRMAEMISADLEKDNLTLMDFFESSLIDFVGALVLLNNDNLTKSEKIKLKIFLYESADAIKIASKALGIDLEPEIRKRFYDILSEVGDDSEKDFILEGAEMFYDPKHYPNLIGSFTPPENNEKN